MDIAKMIGYSHYCFEQQTSRDQSRVSTQFILMELKMLTSRTLFLVMLTIGL